MVSSDCISVKDVGLLLARSRGSLATLSDGFDSHEVSIASPPSLPQARGSYPSPLLMPGKDRLSISSRTDRVFIVLSLLHLDAERKGHVRRLQPAQPATESLAQLVLDEVVLH